MESAYLPLTAANMVKCNLTPPRLTAREIADDLLSFAKALPNRRVRPMPVGRTAIALPPSVVLPLFDFAERTESNRDMHDDTTLTSYSQERPRRRRRITNAVLVRDAYVKEREEEEAKRSMALEVEDYLLECERERELELMDARLEAAAEEIQEYLVEFEVDEQMQLLEARLRRHLEEVEATCGNSW